MYYSLIKPLDVANGTGIRTTLFVSGCRNHCKGCFSPQTWDFNHGQEFTEKEVQLILDSLKHDYVRGLTILGGDPMEPENQEEVYKLIMRVRYNYNLSKTIWMYTGSTYEQLIDINSRWRTQYTDSIINEIDVLVDGPFILELRDIQNVPFRGSTNQRLLDLRKTINEGKIANLELD